MPYNDRQDMYRYAPHPSCYLWFQSRLVVLVSCAESLCRLCPPHRILNPNSIVFVFVFVLVLVWEPYHPATYLFLFLDTPTHTRTQISQIVSSLVIGLDHILHVV